MKTVNRKFILTYLLISLYSVILTMLLDSSITSSFIMLLGGNAVHAGSVDSLVNLGAVLSAVFSAYLLSKFRDYKQMFFVFSMCSLLVLAGLAVVLFAASPGVIVYAVLLSVFCYYFFSGSLALPLYELLKQFVDSGSRVVVMSNCLAIGQLCSMIVSLAVGGLLNGSAGNNLMAYKWIVCFAAFVALLNFATMRRLEKVPVENGASTAKATFGSFYIGQIGDFRNNPPLRLFTAAVMVYALCWSATGLFIGLGYRGNAVRMNEILAAGIFIRTLLKAVCFYLCGQLAKRFGNKAVLITLGITGLISPLTALLLPVDFYVIVLIATNLMPMAYVYFLNHLFERSDDTNFKGRFTLFTLAAVPAALFIPLLGLLVEHQPAVFCMVMILIQLSGIGFVMKLTRPMPEQKPQKEGEVR